MTALSAIKQRWTSSEYPQYGLAGGILTGSLLSSGRRGIPSPLMGALYAAAFGYAGKIASEGKHKDASLASTAWSLAYTFSYLGRSLRPVPLVLALASTANLAFHGSEALLGSVGAS